ncbi:MAG: site-specific integrase [Acidobacteriia bacterium]|nr:site-specific integrase [Terriglobia bacterium]
MEDVPGSDKRVYRSVLLGMATGEQAMTKPEAKRQLKDLIQERGINTEAHLVRSISPVQTFRQRFTFWEENIACHYKPATRTTMLCHNTKHLIPDFGDLPLDQITQDLVQRFITKLHKAGLSPKSIRNIVGVIKLIVDQRIAKDWQLKLPDNPQHEQPYFTLEQMLLIIAAAPEKYKVLFMVLAFTGMRIGEAVGLHIEDVDLVNNVITIRRSVWGGKEQAPKTQNANRRVTIDQNLANALKAHINGKTSGRLFESKKKNPVCANNIAKRILKPILTKLKLQGSFHSFRHGRVSILQQNGVPGDLVKEWIGHSTLRITSRYTHFSDDFRKEIIGRLTPLTHLSTEKGLPG